MSRADLYREAFREHGMMLKRIAEAEKLASDLACALHDLCDVADATEGREWPTLQREIQRSRNLLKAP